MVTYLVTQGSSIKELQFQIIGGLILEIEFLDIKFRKDPKGFLNGNTVNL